MARKTIQEILAALETWVDQVIENQVKQGGYNMMSPEEVQAVVAVVRLRKEQRDGG